MASLDGEVYCAGCGTPLAQLPLPSTQSQPVSATDSVATRVPQDRQADIDRRNEQDESQRTSEVPPELAVERDKPQEMTPAQTERLNEAVAQFANGTISAETLGRIEQSLRGQLPASRTPTDLNTPKRTTPYADLPRAAPPVPSTAFPPGWYPLPDQPRERYWSGAFWTEAYRPLSPAQPIETPPPYHGPAIASMVLGICSLVIWYAGIVTGIVGLVLGTMSLKHVQPRGRRRGRGMAIAGIVCSIVALGLWALILLYAAGGGGG